MHKQQNQQTHLNLFYPDRFDEVNFEFAFVPFWGKLFQ